MSFCENAVNNYILLVIQVTKEYGLKHAERVRRKIESGEEGEEVQGLLEQWLREGKMTEEEALMNASDMFVAGVDTVCIYCGSFVADYV